MRVLVACEFSGVVREAFIKKGHDAWSCDLLDTEIPGNHIKDNVLNVLNLGWDLMIAHPPCTYLANSGVRWLIGNEERYLKMVEAAEFFNKLLDAKIKRIAIENPIMHRYAHEFIRRPDEIVQPWWFGHPETKATCLWLKDLPPLIATFIHTIRTGKVWREPPSPARWKNRSRTYLMLAEAMAEQWG